MLTFIPFEFPTSSDGKYFAVLSEDRIFFNRRTRLGLTQKEVADKAGVPLRQYQRLESGDIELRKSTAEFALSVCAVLLLDPYEMAGVQVKQPDPSTLKPQITFDSGIPEDTISAKRAGRKPIRRDIMNVYFNDEHYSLVIPTEVLIRIGSPLFIKLMWNKDDNRFLIVPVSTNDGESFDVPDHLYNERYNCAGLVFPVNSPFDDVAKALEWGDNTHTVECRIAIGPDHNKLILCDLNTAVPSEKVEGAFVMPACIDSGADDEYTLTVENGGMTITKEDNE